MTCLSVQNQTIWRMESHGFDFTSKSDSLAWIGCDDCESWYCNEISRGIQFGVSEPGDQLRAVHGTSYDSVIYACAAAPLKYPRRVSRP